MRLSRSDHDRLGRATADAAQRIAGGEDADGAVSKAAAAAQLPPGGASLVAAAVNVGRGLAYRAANQGPLDKFAAFDLADPMAGDSAYVSGAAKTASDYAGPPTWTKEAGSRLLHHQTAALPAPTNTTPGPMAILAKAKGIKRAVAQDLQLALAAADAALAKLADDLGAKSGWTPAQLKLAAAVYYDDAGRDLFKAAFARRGWDWDDLPAAKRTPAFDRLGGPFPAADAALAKLAVAADLQQEAAACDAVLADWADKAADLFLSSSAEPAAGTTKDAGLLTLAASNAATALAPRALPEGPSREERLDDVAALADSLETPGFENEHRRIQAQALLAEAMTDERDPLSGYDPDSVLHAYNEISKFAPTASLQPAVVKPLLSRWLAGNQQPFEVKEIADLEQRARAIGRPFEPGDMK